ncbi:hypothetical protein K438DRAFT_2138087 [Mycena galopus ATCC 62051]|nr:hypothetical protein K438DRAFT_2138087 [Mycena galopus ATCC 62051]
MSNFLSTGESRVVVLLSVEWKGRQAPEKTQSRRRRAESLSLARCGSQSWEPNVQKVPGDLENHTDGEGTQMDKWYLVGRKKLRDRFLLALLRNLGDTDLEQQDSGDQVRARSEFAVRRCMPHLGQGTPVGERSGEQYPREWNRLDVLSGRQKRWELRILNDDRGARFDYRPGIQDAERSDSSGDSRNSDVMVRGTQASR